MSTTAPEYLASVRDGMAEAMQQWMDQSTTAWDQWSRVWVPAGGMAPGREHSRGGQVGRTAGCGCSDTRSACGCGQHSGGCQCGDHSKGCSCGDHSAGCQCGGHSKGCSCGDRCRCCVPDADVVIQARVGEVRVVPFHLRNPWRRERPVSLEVGPWHGCDGDGLSVRAVLEDEAIVLAPCEDRVVRLLVAVRPASTDASGDGQGDGTGDGQGDGTGDSAGSKPTLGATDTLMAVRGRVIGDVDRCASAYADVRFEGCARPQRVAVVVLPAGCDAVDVGCDCGCCSQERWTHE